MTKCYSDINIAELQYRVSKQNQSGGKTVGVYTVANSTDYKDRLSFQMSEDQNTNLQCAVYGVSMPLPGQEDKRRSLELSIESESLITFLKALDERNIEAAVENSVEWFKKPLDRNTVENMYTPLVRTPTSDKADMGYKPTVRTKIKIAEQYNSNIWIVIAKDGNDMTCERGVHQDIGKGSKCMAIVETSGLWFASKQFGMSLAVNDIMIWPSEKKDGMMKGFKLATGTRLSEKRSIDAVE